ncbi:MAG: prepilin-type N-terminal cleavage/methylation domain-containing protein [Alphaproteobacteria bacterium]|uniref:prepilin-type N-terminal cleavage/methylation domain-containing protein n=1 Tax=Aestuariivirga sp. TaxID=2650926 RepID=UPI003016548E|nr:prepilin-type N-terminal cleavage/methylation domain-containing protein [Alphaproteobacteria bacterium]
MPTSRTEAQAGFTLLELLAVLVIMALSATAVMSIGRASLESARARSFIVDAEALFRDARTQAIESHSQTAVIIDIKRRRLSLEGGRSLEMPQGLSLDAKVAVPKNGGLPAVRFFPSGSSSGGELAFGFRGRSYGLHINWLTGRADVQAL